MIDPNNYFDISGILINEFIGDVWLSVILGSALVAYFSIKYKMSYELTILFEILFLSTMFGINTSLEGIWVFIVMIVGVLFYYGMARLMGR